MDGGEQVTAAALASEVLSGAGGVVARREKMFATISALPKKQAQKLVCDLMWVLGHWGRGDRVAEIKELLVQLKDGFLKTTAQADAARGTLSLDTLGVIKLEEPKQTADTVRKRHNTRNRKWDIYDLHEEEPEGYCKLFVYLTENLSKASAADTVKFLREAVATHSLYPHRCVDMLLGSMQMLCPDSWAAVPSKQLEGPTEVLRTIGVHVEEILGFRFLQHHSDQSVLPHWAKGRDSKVLSVLRQAGWEKTADYYAKPQPSLYLLTAHLIKEEILAYADLAPFMQPSLEVLMKESEDYIAKRLTCVQQMVEKDREHAEVQQPRCFKNNDHYRLVIALLRTEQDAKAVDLLDRFAALQPMAHAELANALVDHLVGKLREPAKLANGKTAAETPLAAVLDPLLACESLLMHLGHCISKSTTLLRAVVDCVAFTVAAAKGRARAASAVLSNMADVAKEGEGIGHEAVERLLLQVVQFCLVPALSILSTTPGVGDEMDETISRVSKQVAALLSPIPYRRRYQMYDEIQSAAEADDAELQLAAKRTADSVARGIRRSINDMGKRSARVLEGSPLAACTTLLRYAVCYPSAEHVPAADAVRSAGPLCADVCVFKMVSLLHDLPDVDTSREQAERLGAMVGALLTTSRDRSETDPILDAVLWCAKQGKALQLAVLVEIFRTVHVDALEADGSGEKVTRRRQLLELGGAARLEYGSLLPGVHSGGGLPKPLFWMLRERLCCNGLARELLQILSRLHEKLPFKKLDAQSHSAGLRHIKLCLTSVQQALALLARFVSLCTATYEKGADADSPPFTLASSLSDMSLSALHDAGFQPALVHTLLRSRCTAKPPSAAQAEAQMGLTSTIVQRLLQPLLSQTESGAVDVYTSFWSLDLSDLSPATDAFEAMLSEAQKKADSSKLKAEKNKRALAAAKAHVAKLERLKSDQASHVEAVAASLKDVAKGIFAPMRTATTPGSRALDRKAMFALYNAFLQVCFWPRVLLSTEDAVFCARWLQLCGPLGFPTVRFTSFLSDTLWRLLPTCTDAEAARVGTFLVEHLRTWEHCLIDQKAIDGGKPIDAQLFCAGFHVPLAKGALSSLAREAPAAEHRAAVELLNTIVPHFPMCIELCERIEEAMKHLVETKDTVTTQYIIALRQRKSDIEGKKSAVANAAVVPLQQLLALPQMGILLQDSAAGSRAQRRLREAEEREQRREEQRKKEEAKKEEEAKKAEEKAKKAEEKGDDEAGAAKREGDKAKTEPPAKRQRTMSKDKPKEKKERERQGSEREKPKDRDRDRDKKSRDRDGSASKRQRSAEHKKPSEGEKAGDRAKRSRSDSARGKPK
eukprot:TRINITY_DN10192_c0_g4_i1.p1 TRINITY_DN10192_c0_g4~~TRINITY_DN10192_c0_g4_i1.p1  ORF type:complete len:1353 (+),score=537.97 TRINITY_DN10192_c0_g4_i1:70-4059(+)